jgi:hypothetical protein
MRSADNLTRKLVQAPGGEALQGGRAAHEGTEGRCARKVVDDPMGGKTDDLRRARLADRVIAPARRGPFRRRADPAGGESAIRTGTRAAAHRRPWVWRGRRRRCRGRQPSERGRPAPRGRRPPTSARIQGGRPGSGRGHGFTLGFAMRKSFTP